MTDGGIGHSGKRMSDETKQKLRQANLGKKYSEETRAKLSAIRLGKKIKSGWTTEKRENLRIKRTGCKHTDEAKKKISASSKGNKHNIGRKWTDSRRLVMPLKPIIQCDIMGNVLQEYESIIAAATSIGVTRDTLTNIISGKTKKPNKERRGFIFKFKTQ
jgi:hypothetical protein